MSATDLCPAFSAYILNNATDSIACAICQGLLFALSAITAYEFAPTCCSPSSQTPCDSTSATRQNSVLLSMLACVTASVTLEGGIYSKTYCSRMHVHPLVMSLLILLQDHHGSGFAVFWMGIAFWLLFALMPSRYLVSLVHKHAHQVQVLLQAETMVRTMLI